MSVLGKTRCENLTRLDSIASKIHIDNLIFGKKTLKGPTYRLRTVRILPEIPIWSEHGHA